MEAMMGEVLQDVAQYPRDPVGTITLPPDW
jgi:hypothetical protein